MASREISSLDEAVATLDVMEDFGDSVPELIKAVRTGPANLVDLSETLKQLLERSQALQAFFNVKS